MLSREHRAHFFQLETRKNKWDILNEKREDAKKCEFTLESGNVDTYAVGYFSITKVYGPTVISITRGLERQVLRYVTLKLPIRYLLGYLRNIQCGNIISEQV